MPILLSLRRWRALRGILPLAQTSAEGARVKATGIVHAIEDTIVSPVANTPAVIVRTRFGTPSADATVRTVPPPNRDPHKPIVIERWHLRPFALDLEASRVIVDGPVLLLLPERSEGHMREIAVAVGSRVTVIGSVLRDGVERPNDDLAFREVVFSCRLVGSRERPIVITDSD